MEVLYRMTLRSKVAVLLAEFLGTAILATAAINISRSQIGIAYFVAIGVGLVMGLLVLVFGKVSGAHVNPAVTVGLWTVRKIGTLKALSYVAAQMLGGLAAWQLANFFNSGEIMSIAPKQFEWTALVAEAVGAFVFTFAIAAAIYQDLEIGKKAAVIGGGLTAGVIIASLGSSAIINPAVALANQSWAKAYIFGPIIGGVIGFNLYVLFFAPISALIPSKKLKVSKTSKEDKSSSEVPKKTASTAKVVSKSSSVKKAPVKKTATKSTAKKKATTKKK